MLRQELITEKVTASELRNGDVIRYSEYSMKERSHIVDWKPITRLTKSPSGKTVYASGWAFERVWRRKMRADTIVVRRVKAAR